MEMGKPHRPTLPEGESVRALAQRYIEVAARALKQKNASAFAGIFTIADIKERGLYQKEILMTRIADLERPFPSAPKVPPRYVIAVTRQSHYNTEAFVAMYAAHIFVLAVINEREYKWLSSNELKVEDTTIKGDRLEDIIEYKLKPSELKWELPEPYASRAHFLATGERHTPELPPNPILTPKQTRTIKAQTGVKAARSKPLTNRMRADREGLVSIQDICATLSIEPRIARGVLRKSNTPKPSHGWAFDKKEAERITKLIKDSLK